MRCTLGRDEAHPAPVKFVLENAHVLGRSEVARMPVPGRVEALLFAVVVSAVDPALWFEPALELDHPSALQELLDSKCGTLQTLERARLGEVRDRA